MDQPTSQIGARDPCTDGDQPQELSPRLSGGFVVGAPGRCRGGLDPAPTAGPGRRAARSFAQGGEDIAAGDFFFQYIGSPAVTYLDIPVAYDPIKINNTYFFYRRGNRGVLVEPRRDDVREVSERCDRGTPRSAAGIGVTAVKEADYYLYDRPPPGTPSRRRRPSARRYSPARISPSKKVIKMPLLNINDVMKEHFESAPDVSPRIDAEGLHLAILQSIDFDRFPLPPLICVETLISGTRQTIQETPQFRDDKQGLHRPGRLVCVNTLFVDARLLK